MTSALGLKARMDRLAYVFRRLSSTDSLDNLDVLGKFIECEKCLMSKMQIVSCILKSEFDVSVCAELDNLCTVCNKLRQIQEEGLNLF